MNTRRSRYPEEGRDLVKVGLRFLNPYRTMTVPSYRSLLFLCCLITYGCYFGAYMRVPIVPLYAHSLGADALKVGMINSAFMLTAGVLSIPLGILSDHVGRKLLIMCGLLILTGSAFLLYCATSATQMIGIYFVFGIGMAAFAPTMMSFVADFSPPSHMGRSYGWYTLALYTGMCLGPAAGGFVAGRLKYQPTFLISGLTTVLVLVTVFFLLPRARHVLVHRPQKRFSGAIASDLIRNVPLLTCWLATLGGCFGLGMFITFVPLQAQARGIGVEQIGVIFAAQALANALSRIPFGQLSDRVANRSILVVIGLVGFSAATAGFGTATTTWIFVILAAGLGISMGIAFTSIGALIAEVVSPAARGLAMGGYNSAIYLGMMLSSLIMGALIRHLGFRDCFFLVAVVNLIIAGLFYLLFKRYQLQATGINET